jgi:Fe-S-cluster-containing dehydrogenase component
MKRLFVIGCLMCLAGCAYISKPFNTEVSAVVEANKTLTQTLTQDPASLQETAGMLAGLYAVMIGEANLDAATMQELEKLKGLCSKKPEDLTALEKGELIGFTLKYRAEVLTVSLDALSSKAQSIVGKIAALNF